MKRQIRLLLNELVLRGNVVGSWGISSIFLQEDKLDFHVSAFLYRGQVSIEAERDTYTIQLGNAILYGVPLEKVVPMIDNMVEADKNYPDNIKDWIRGILHRKP